MGVARTVFASLTVAAAAIAAGYAATDGFDALTYESARRLQALRAPAPIAPDLRLELHDGSVHALADWGAPVLLVDFVYTRCPTMCVALGSTYQRLARRLAPEIARGEVRLLSVSFDPEHDDPAALAAYRARHAPRPAGWDIGRPPDPASLRRWLDTFGVVVLPDGRGGFVHNAAVAVVGPDRRLHALLEIGAQDRVARAARALLADVRVPEP